MLELVRHVHRDVTVGGHEEARHLIHGPEGHELAPRRLQVQDESQSHDHVPWRLQVTVPSGKGPKEASTTASSRSRRHGGLHTNSNTGVRSPKPASTRRRSTRSTRRTLPQPAPPHKPPESMNSTLRTPSDSEWRLTSDFFDPGKSTKKLFSTLITR